MAVYTHVSADELDRFLGQYDIGKAVAFKGIAEGVENSNYLLVTEAGTYILTLYEKRVNPDDLPFFLGLMDHLAARGIPSPLPVHTRSGASLGELNGRPACIISFLKGMSVKVIDPAHCTALGASLAAMHRAGDGFSLTRPNALSVAGWQSLTEKCRDRADEVLPGLSRMIVEEAEFLVSHWPQDLPAGVIHADLFPDNVFFMGNEISGLIDYYFACNDLLAYDLAICVNAWCFERDGALNVTKASRMVASYHRARPMSEAEQAAFPILCRGAALRFLLSRLYDWLNPVPGALVTPKNPLDYAVRLRFHREAQGIASYAVLG